ncbi:MAG TPA: NAD(P)H-binding protein [Solirubrobacteraceae bacterium]|nr:NAD(P)H-binding protein [Solirubrobacteraceae bacterium]
MRILVTGITGYVGGALTPRLQRDGHDVVGMARNPDRAKASGVDVPVTRGDVLSGEGLEQALDGADVAYYLIHSMERADASAGTFAHREEQGARAFAEAAAHAGVKRVVYLGGILPAGEISPHMASRLKVEELLLEHVPDSVGLRASIVIGARSRSFRFLVRLVERVPVLPMPPWARFRTQPIDGRDMLELLVSAATTREAGGRSLDIAGPDVVTYGQMLEKIADLMMVGRPRIDIPVTMNGVASRVAAAIAGEDPGLIEPLMGSLGADILPRDDSAAGLLGVRLHGFERAVERALREWESLEPGSVAAR